MLGLGLRLGFGFGLGLRLGFGFGLGLEVWVRVRGFELGLCGRAKVKVIVRDCVSARVRIRARISQGYGLG